MYDGKLVIQAGKVVQACRGNQQRPAAGEPTLPRRMMSLCGCTITIIIFLCASRST